MGRKEDREKAVEKERELIRETLQSGEHGFLSSDAEPLRSDCEVKFTIPCTPETLEFVLQAEENLRKAGVWFDTGLGDKGRDWFLDWSLDGATVHFGKKLDFSSEKIVDKDYLESHPDHIFVFGDNLKRVGKGGAGNLRHMPNTYGFITKKEPNMRDASFYTPDEYLPVFYEETTKLEMEIIRKPTKRFLITKLGSGLANRYKIFEQVIEPRIRVLGRYPNVEFLW